MRARRRKVVLLILLAFVFGACVCLYSVWMRNADFKTNGEVVRAIIQDSLTYYVPDRPDDSPRVIVIDHGYPDSMFVVTRGRPSSETVLAAGHFDRRTWRIRDLPKLPKTLWDMFPEGKYATFALPCSVVGLSKKDALVNLQSFAPQDTLQSVPYEDSVMWKYAVVKRWFRSDEKVFLIFIDRNPGTVIKSSSWDVSGGYTCGEPRQLGRPGIGAQVNLATLKITHFVLD